MNKGASLRHSHGHVWPMLYTNDTCHLTFHSLQAGIRFFLGTLEDTYTLLHMATWFHDFLREPRLGCSPQALTTVVRAQPDTLQHVCGHAQSGCHRHGSH